MWIGQLITAQASAKNTSAKRLWQQLRQREVVKKIAVQVKRALGDTHVHCGLVQVDAPDPQDPAKRLLAVMKPTLEQACLDEAQRRFTQVAGTPLLQLPLTTRLGSLQIGLPEFMQILEGTFPYDTIQEEFTRKLLQQLHKLISFCEVEPQSEGEYKYGWQAACSRNHLFIPFRGTLWSLYGWGRSHAH